MLRWRDEIRIGLCVDRIVWVRVGRGLRARVTEKRVIPVPARETLPVWSAALDTLSAALKQAQDARRQAAVILSNRLVRYAVVPWHDALISRTERLAQARHCFKGIYGEIAASWSVMVNSGGYRQPGLATAVDTDLIDGLRREFRNVGIPLASIQPYLAAACSQFRHTIARDGTTSCFCVIEPDDICTLQIGHGVPHGVFHQRIHEDWKQELRGQLLQAAGDGAFTGIDSVCVFGPDRAPRELRSLAREVVSLNLPVMPGYSPPADPGMSMGLVGVR